MSRTKSFFRNALPPHFLKAVLTIALIMVAIPLWAGPAKNKTEVVADEATKTLHIVVDGKDVAVFDSQGLHVDGDVGLTGAFHPGSRNGGPPPWFDTAPVPPARKP
jgi:hypothetical protein